MTPLNIDRYFTHWTEPSVELLVLSCFCYKELHVTWEHLAITFTNAECNFHLFKVFSLYSNEFGFTEFEWTISMSSIIKAAAKRQEKKQ